MSHRVIELHNIMPMVNIPSVLQLGILSNEKINLLKISSESIAYEETQKKRDKKQVPQGLKVHQYANLYFDARNPMMYVRKDKEICVLRISKEVLSVKGVVLSDQNVSSNYVRFYSPQEIDNINFDLVFAKDWRHPNDQIAFLRHKSAKCAEVLVPHCVPSKFIIGAYVSDENSKEKMKSKGFTSEITINPNIFFREESK